jgi:site-specific recombinase XerD
MGVDEGSAKFATNKLRLVHSLAPATNGGVNSAVLNHKQMYALPGVWETLVDEWVTWLTASGAPTTTRRLRRAHVREIARRSATTHPREVDLALLVRLCSEQSWSKEHRRGVRCSLNQFFEWAKNRSHIDTNPAEQLPKISAGVGLPRPVPERMLKELLMGAPPRERLMMRLAGEAGMRRGEVAVCHSNDIINDLYGWSLLVHGKGGKQRMVPVDDSLVQAIHDFCPCGGYVFPGQIGGHISAQHVGILISRQMGDDWTMHKLRHRYATHCLNLGYNLMEVKELIGHTSVATTQRYTAVAQDQLRRHVGRMGPT